MEKRKLTAQGQADSDALSTRVFTTDSLAEIDRIIRNGPFDSVTWWVTDELGRHTAGGLGVLLEDVLWDSVTKVSLQALQTVEVEDERDTASVYLNILPEWFFLGWSCGEICDQHGVELAFRKIDRLIQSLPESEDRANLRSCGNW